MQTYAITELGRLFGLSRSTLLYYDRIGLLHASGRTHAGYRCYTEPDRARLERICLFRRAGLSLTDIREMLNADIEPSAELLEKRLQALSEEISQLRSQQHLITALLRKISCDTAPATPINKQMWVEMLQAAGMDEAAMRAWHTGFELRAPREHHDFLVSLGIEVDEVERIRQWSRGGASSRD